MATYSNGVPVSDDAVSPVLYFKTSDYDTDYSIHYATVSATYQHSYTVSSAGDLTCSFAGGCLLEVEGTSGLLTAMAGGYASISVCGEQCVVDEDESSSTTTKCAVPAVSTLASEASLGLTEAGLITGTTFADTDDAKDAPWDENNQNGYESESTDSCHFGTAFDAGYVGYLEQAAYMMNAFDRDLFVGLLQF